MARSGIGYSACPFAVIEKSFVRVLYTFFSSTADVPNAIGAVMLLMYRPVARLRKVIVCPSDVVSDDVISQTSAAYCDGFTVAVPFPSSVMRQSANFDTLLLILT